MSSRKRSPQHNNKSWLIEGKGSSSSSDEGMLRIKQKKIELKG